ncbi:hypothetical protein N7456_000588 [Penicillium angulare]|uniref:Uncharacterized protein n=1 Tax=Penicillium angulare TaxID=116970 RepID=A0A9W9KS95_9EURO|nr:hypothetical protein N7456_000588 [Penicillium angulare]
MKRFAPEILETGLSVEQYEKDIKLGLCDGIEIETSSDDSNPESGIALDMRISFSYHKERSLNRIHIVDATTLASDGPDAGKVLIVFFDEFGQTVRYSREDSDYAVEITALTNGSLDDHPCWHSANIGELYQRGQQLGPPYSENFGGDS